MKWIKRAALFFILLPLLWFSVHLAFTLYYGLADKTGKADVGVVFGTGAVSPRLEARISKTLSLYKAGMFNKIFITGVKGEVNFMYDFLIKNQVPAKAIARDYKGYSTYDSLANLKVYIKKHKINKILAVSQYFHILRIKLSFSLIGIGLDYHAHANLFEWNDVYMTLREFVAYYVYLWNYTEMSPARYLQ